MTYLVLCSSVDGEEASLSDEHHQSRRLLCKLVLAIAFLTFCMSFVKRSLCLVKELLCSDRGLIHSKRQLHKLATAKCFTGLLTRRLTCSLKMTFFQSHTYAVHPKARHWSRSLPIRSLFRRFLLAIGIRKKVKVMRDSIFTAARNKSITYSLMKCIYSKINLYCNIAFTP